MDAESHETVEALPILSYKRAAAFISITAVVNCDVHVGRQRLLLGNFSVDEDCLEAVEARTSALIAIIVIVFRDDRHRNLLHMLRKRLSSREYTTVVGKHGAPARPRGCSHSSAPRDGTDAPLRPHDSLQGWKIVCCTLQMVKNLIRRNDNVTTVVSVAYVAASIENTARLYCK